MPSDPGPSGAPPAPDTARSPRPRPSPGGPPSRERPRRFRALLAVGAAVVVVVAAIGVVLAVEGSGGSDGGSSGVQVDLAQVNAWQNQSNAAGPSYAGNDTLWIAPGAGMLLVRMGPSGFGERFVINGLVDPTIHLPAGTSLAIPVVNLDASASHDWVVTTAAPPYGTSGGPGGGMMGGFGGMWGTGMMGAAHGGMYWSQTLHEGFTSPGTYWYVCTYPGHASDGMYGELVVG